MSRTLISFLIAVGASAWIYNKFMKYTGNNTKTAIIATAAAGLFIFFVFFTVLGFIIG